MVTCPLQLVADSILGASQLHAMLLGQDLPRSVSPMERFPIKTLPIALLRITPPLGNARSLKGM